MFSVTLPLVKTLSPYSVMPKTVAPSFGNKQREVSQHQNKAEQLVDYYKNLILSGTIKEGNMPVAKCKLAKDLGVAVQTLDKVFEQLIKEGYLRKTSSKNYMVQRPSQRVSNNQARFNKPFTLLSPSEQAIETFKKKVKASQLKVGEVIPTYQALAELLNVSRPTLYNSVVPQLEKAGFILVDETKGFIVTAPTQDAQKLVVAEIKRMIESGEIQTNIPVKTVSQIRNLFKANAQAESVSKQQVYGQLEAEGYLTQKMGVLYTDRPLQNEAKQVLQDVSINTSNLQWLQEQAAQAEQKLGEFLDALITMHRHRLKSD